MMSASKLKSLWFALFALLALGTGVLQAASELDGDAARAPRFIVKKLDPGTHTITSYALPSLDDSLRPENLNKLSSEERTAKLQSFFAQVESSGTKVSEEKVQSSRSELDGETSTSACWIRWRGCVSGGYYGAGFFGFYGGARFYYTPTWGYGGFYGGGYYGYNPGYGAGQGYGAPGYPGDRDPGYGVGRPGYPGDRDPGYGVGRPGSPGDRDPGYGVGRPGYPGDRDPGYGVGRPGYPVDPGYGVSSPGYGSGYGYAGAGYNNPSYTLYGFGQ